MQVIFSCENSGYMWWQAELLHHSFTRAGMECQLTALVSHTPQAALPFSCRVMRVSNYAEVVEGMTYPALNKPGAIWEWARRFETDEVVFIVDPDSVFVRRVKDPGGSLHPSEAMADQHDYMDPDLPGNKVVLDRHCRPVHRHKVQPVGVYIQIQSSVLAELAARWLEKAIDIKSDAVCRAALPDDGWISEMWGYAIAAAELGLYHHAGAFSQVTGSNSLDCPIIHYCFPVPIDDPDRETAVSHPETWHKGQYRPWDFPTERARTVEGQKLLSVLNELALARSLAT